MKIILFALVITSPFAFGQQNVSIGTEGKITRIEAEGNLASQRTSPLVSLEEASSSDTPVDLFDLSARKLREGDYDAAAMAFMVATAYGSYDQQRVADKTAHQGIEALINQKMGDATDEQKEKFQTIAVEILKNPSGFVANLKRMGKPSYHPAYMIQHGMGAVYEEKPANGGLVEGFDGDVEWNKLLAEISKS
jgi:hypothetical protein